MSASVCEADEGNDEDCEAATLHNNWTEKKKNPSRDEDGDDENDNMP